MAKTRAEYQREWIRKRKALYKAGKVCVQCGSEESLEWHHRNPAEKWTSNPWSYAKHRLEAELAKCDLLCNECHKEITREQRAVALEHGTHKGYTRGCRCEACRHGHTEYMRRWRATLC